MTRCCAGVVARRASQGPGRGERGGPVVFSEATKAPIIVRKRDGAFTYATTDLAKVKYCKDTWNADLLLYVVDSRQGDHFKQVFEVASRWGYADMRLPARRLRHDPGRTAARSRPATATSSAWSRCWMRPSPRPARSSARTRPTFPKTSIGRVAEVVGLGAIKYADLSQNRTSDYVFDLDRMLAMNGNTATYLQYAYARIQSSSARGSSTPEAIRAAARRSGPATRPSAAWPPVIRLPETVDWPAPS